MPIDVRKEEPPDSNDRTGPRAGWLPSVIVGAALALFALFGLNAWAWWD